VAGSLTSELRALTSAFVYTSRMEIPAKVSVFNRTLEIKGKAAMLVAINSEGFFEIVLEVQQRNHTVLLPIAETVLIFNEALPQAAADVEIER
jgi:hypothetical protein